MDIDLSGNLSTVKTIWCTVVRRSRSQVGLSIAFEYPLEIRGRRSKVPDIPVLRRELPPGTLVVVVLISHRGTVRLTDKCGKGRAGVQRGD